MASPYALPSSALPHAHQHRMHAHTQSQSSINSWKSSMSNSTLPPHTEDEDDHQHDHSRHHSHGRTPSQISNTSATLAVPGRRPPPLQLDSMNGWTQETTSGGKSVITPGPDTVTAPYLPPKQQHHHHDDHGHHHYGHDHAHSHDDHNHNKERSLFTRLLLPYTARYPLLHAIMTEKDSRRIFYFMV